MHINLANGLDYLDINHNEDGFFMVARKRALSAIIPCGTADTLVRLMLANHVRHFDYGDALADNADAMYEFMKSARELGLEI